MEGLLSTGPTPSSFFFSYFQSNSKINLKPKKPQKIRPTLGTIVLGRSTMVTWELWRLLQPEINLRGPCLQRAVSTAIYYPLSRPVLQGT